jgi:hypothetical protein
MQGQTWLQALAPARGAVCMTGIHKLLAEYDALLEWTGMTIYCF